MGPFVPRGCMSGGHLSLGAICPQGHLSLGAICPGGHLSIGAVCPGGRLSLKAVCTGAICPWRALFEGAECVLEPNDGGPNVWGLNFWDHFWLQAISWDP
jgi:hypothetical protein